MLDIKPMNFAVQAHANVNHLYNGNPYSVHLFMVVANAIYFKWCISKHMFDTVVSACWLHDTIEDCRLSYNDVYKVFGDGVANIVYAVSNDKGKNRKERAGEKYYKGIRETPCATYVKLFDRLANVQFSKQSKNPQFEMYKKENEHFLGMLGADHAIFQPIVRELRNLFIEDQP